MINKKIEQARTLLEGLIKEDELLETRKEELEIAVREAETEEEIGVAEESVEELETEKAELEEKKSKLEGEIETLEIELEELKSKTPKNDERGKGDEKNMEKRNGFVEYVRSKGATREGFTSIEGGALIPEELLDPKLAPENVVDLTKYVRVVKVNSGGGKYPVIKKSGSKMLTVAELEANPELAKPDITEINYDIDTYRGYIPISQEVIDDADYDVEGLIRDEITDQERNTKNEAIAAILKTAPAKSVTGIDGLKKVFNVDISKAYAPMAIITSSLFNELDTTKDDNGRYLLQDDITSPSGKSLFGYKIEVLDDEMIGTAAEDLKGFIGDAREFMALFDRKAASVKWTDHNVYGELLAGFVRFDTKPTDTEAGFYVTYTPQA